MKTEIRTPSTSAGYTPGLWERRTVLAAILAGSAVGCTGMPQIVQRDENMPPEGKEIYSESIQVSLADASGEKILSIRLCQYPDASVAWVWAAVFIDGKFYQVADNSVPWRGPRSINPDANEASYQAQSDTARLSFVRAGKLGQPSLGRMKFKSTYNPELEADVTFRQTELFENLIPGRTEVFGFAEATVSVGGKVFRFEGPGQWHEQQQTDARFVTPFVYASFWGDGTFATFLETQEAAGGYIIRPDGVTGFTGAKFSKPGDQRSVVMTGDAGASEFSFQVRHRYTVKIYGTDWQGSFVHGSIGDAPVSGFINSWKYFEPGGLLP